MNRAVWFKLGLLGMVAAACGGHAAGEQRAAGGGSGGGAGKPAMQAGTADAKSQPPMTGGSMGVGGGVSPAAGTDLGSNCTALCISEAQFVFDSRATREELMAGVLRACRNEECLEDTLPMGGGDTVSFSGALQGPTVFSVDGWASLNFIWQVLPLPDDLADGDRFRLSLVLPDRSIELLDRVVEFETTSLCGGTCQKAFVDLTGEGAGGAGGGWGGGQGGEDGGAGAPAAGNGGQAW